MYRFHCPSFIHSRLLAEISEEGEIKIFSESGNVRPLSAICDKPIDLAWQIEGFLLDKMSRDEAAEGVRLLLTRHTDMLWLHWTRHIDDEEAEEGEHVD